MFIDVIQLGYNPLGCIRVLTYSGNCWEMKEERARETASHLNRQELRLAHSLGLAKQTLPEKLELRITASIRR